MFGRRRDRHAVGSDARDIRARENTNGVEGYCDYTYVYEGRHSGLCKLPGDIADVTYYEDLGKDN